MHRRVSRGGGLEIETQKKVIRAHFKLFHLHYATFFVENIIFSTFHKDLYKPTSMDDWGPSHSNKIEKFQI